jgi:hypothetical protein
LPRDDARFCNNCGTLVPNHPFSLQSLSAAKGFPPSSTDQPGNKKDQPGRSKAPLREQIAQQPPATPRRPLQTDPPAWISQLDTLEHNMVISKKARDERQVQALEEETRDEGSQLRELSPAESKDEEQQALAPAVDSLVETPTASWPNIPSGEPIQPTEVEPATKKDDVPAPVAEEAGTQLEAKSQKPPEHALRVKVWEQGEPVPPLQDRKEAAGEDIVEDLPTGPLVVEHNEPNVQRDSLPPPILSVQTPRFEEVTDLDTIPLSAQHQVGFTPAQSAGQVMQAHPHPGDRAAQKAVHTPYYTSTPPANQPALRTAQEAPGSTPVLPPQHQVWGQQSPTPAFAPQARRSRRRVPVPVILTLICLFVLGGVAAWILKFQPFSIPQVTQPQQRFQSSALGVSLSYPSGWSVQVDRKNGTAHFSDSSHTAQFSVIVMPANGQDAGQYLLKQATQLGLTGTKPGPQLSFGGSTWQQTQGAVQQAGANYTEVLLATTHGSHLVSIMQQAPQVIYTDEEQAVFASVRSSFQFLS